MIKLFQTFGRFYVSKFEAAVKAMQESCKQTWAQKVSDQEKNQLWALYKQATEGDKQQPQMTTESGTYPNMGSPMTSFRSGEGRETAQGATEGDVLKQQLKSEKKMSDNKTYFDQNAQKTSRQGYGNRTGQQAGQKTTMKTQKKGSDTGSPLDKERNQMWNKSEGKSKEQAQDEYIQFARRILEKNNAHKYLKDL